MSNSEKSYRTPLGRVRLLGSAHLGTEETARLRLTSIALVLGLVVVNVLKPGVGMNVDMHSVHSAAVDAYVAKAHHVVTTSEFLLNVIPHTAISAFAVGSARSSASSRVAPTRFPPSLVKRAARSSSTTFSSATTARTSRPASPP